MKTTTEYLQGMLLPVWKLHSTMLSSSPRHCTWLSRKEPVAGPKLETWVASLAPRNPRYRQTTSAAAMSKSSSQTDPSLTRMLPRKGSEPPSRRISKVAASSGGTSGSSSKGGLCQNARCVAPRPITLADDPGCFLRGTQLGREEGAVRDVALVSPACEAVCQEAAWPWGAVPGSCGGLMGGGIAQHPAYHLARMDRRKEGVTSASARSQSSSQM